MTVSTVSLDLETVKAHHVTLNTTFYGIEHPTSTPEAPIHQFLGIKYASIPARFRQSSLFNVYPPLTDASRHGPICPQPSGSKTPEELLFGVRDEDIPQQSLKHDEFECLNLNITRPGDATPHSRIPVILWIHGGGDRGSGSHWIYDGAPLVRKSMSLGKPIMLVTFNFRIGLLGFAASPMIRDDNALAGDEGTGNYGLRDQQQCMEWVYRYIDGFGGDPNNITLCGASSGAADIVCHLLSESNQSHPMFARAVVSSAVLEPTLPDVSSAGWHLSRVLSSLGVNSMEKLRSIEVEKLFGLGSNIRTVDDGYFFREGWNSCFSSSHQQQPVKRHSKSSSSHHLHLPTPTHAPHSRFSSSRSRSRSALRTLRSPSRQRTPGPVISGAHQPLIIGDGSCDSLLWSAPISLWTAPAVVRRVKAVCQSLSKATNLLRAYDITSSTPEEEIADRVLDLVNDVRVAWPTEFIAQYLKRERGGKNVWRFVFDQEGPGRGIPHHGADLIYLFDTVPLPESALSPGLDPETFFDGPFDVDDDEEITPNSVNGLEWEIAPVDEYSYARVRDALQEKFISFANGEMPWREDKVFVFGPEGETGERSFSIFEGRRRKSLWKESLEPLGHALVQKVGVELSRGPCGSQS